jgi:hypothetical protein
MRTPHTHTQVFWLAKSLFAVLFLVIAGQVQFTYAGQSLSRAHLTGLGHDHDSDSARGFASSVPTSSFALHGLGQRFSRTEQFSLAPYLLIISQLHFVSANARQASLLRPQALQFDAITTRAHCSSKMTQKITQGQIKRAAANPAGVVLAPSLISDAEGEQDNVQDVVLWLPVSLQPQRLTSSPSSLGRSTAKAAHVWERSLVIHLTQKFMRLWPTLHRTF